MPGVFWGIYGAVVVLFVMMSFLEGWAHHDRWTTARLTGLLCALIWPLMLAFFLLHSRLSPLFHVREVAVPCEYRAGRSKKA